MAKIPRFEGEDPVAARIKINSISSDSEVLKRKARVYLCVEAVVVDVDHADSPAGLIRLQKAGMERVMVMDAGEAKEMLDAADEQRKRAQEEEEGITRLPGT